MVLSRVVLLCFCLLFLAPGCRDAAKGSEPSKKMVPLTAEAAENLYVRACASCHGIQGKGDGPRGRRIGGMPDFTDPAFHSSRLDDDLMKVIVNGSGRMPGFKHRFNQHELQALLEVVRKKSR